MHQDDKDVKFLIKENKLLKEQIQQLKEVIKVNKASIDILSNSRAENPGGRDKVNMTMDAGSITSTKSREESRLLGVVKMLNNQNSDLLKQLESVKQLNEELNTKILLLEQITEASQKHEQRTLLEMESEMQSLNKTLIKTQDKLLENQRGHGHFDSMSGLMIKYKEVHSYTEQASRFMQIEEQLTREIHVHKATIEELKNSRDRLASINVSLKNEVIKLKATMLMPNRTFDPAGEASLKRLALYFLDAQRKVCEDSDYEDDLELVAPELMVLFPDKVNKVNGIKEKPKVPRLNLLKAHQMMLSNQKKIEADLKRRNNMTKTQRISKLQEELQFTRRQLTRTMLHLKQVQTQKAQSQRVIEQLQGRNRLLLDNYDAMRKRMKNMRPMMKKSNVDLNKTYNVSFMNCTFIDKNPQYTKESGPINRKQDSIKRTQDQFILTEKEQFEIQANNMAHQVAKLPLIDAISNRKLRTKPDRKPQLIRSYSNPLLYMEQRKDIIFNRKPKDEQKLARVPEPIHHDQTCFDRIDSRAKGFEQNLDDINL